MNKKNIIKPLVITLLIIISFTLIIAAVYFVLNYKYGVPEKLLNDVKKVILELRNTNFERPLKTDNFKETYYNLIMTETKENEKTECFVLETVNAASGGSLLITIPKETRITMSNALYVELQGEMPAIPQIIQMSSVIKQAGPAKGPLYAKRILEDFLGITIDYYTVMPVDAFYDIFEISSGVTAIREDISELLKLPVTKRKTMEYFKYIYTLEGFMSTMSYENKCKYLEYYEGLSSSDIITYAADGKNMNEAFIMDSVKVNQVIYKFLHE